MAAFNPPSAWPEMRQGAPEFPKSLDAKAPSHPAKARTGSSHSPLTKANRNKGGDRMTCMHAATGHGPCGCNNSKKSPGLKTHG